MAEVPDAVRRVSARDIDGLLETELRRRLAAPADRPLRELLACVGRVDLEAQVVRIRFNRAKTPRSALDDAEHDFANHRPGDRHPAGSRKAAGGAFLASDIQKQIIAGRQPRGLTLERLLNEPIAASWSAQREQFGFADRL